MIKITTAIYDEVVEILSTAGYGMKRLSIRHDIYAFSFDVLNYT